MRIEISSLGVAVICEIPQELATAWLPNYFWNEYIPAVSMQSTSKLPELTVKLGDVFCWNKKNITATNTETDLRSLVVIVGALLERKRQRRRLYQVHGSAVAINDKAVVLIGGMSGIGKTSLAIALQNAPNAEFIGDEKFVLNGKKQTVVAACPLSKDNNKTGASLATRTQPPKPVPLQLVIFPVITDELDITVHKFDSLKLFWHLYEESSRDIRNLNFLYNGFSETKDSFDTKSTMNHRLTDIKKISETVPAYFIRGNLSKVSEWIYNLMNPST